MNAQYVKAAWNWMPPARRRRLKRRSLGFALHEADKLQGLPWRTANAHARFEYEARQALREWLML
jgi:hypothetical protein